MSGEVDAAMVAGNGRVTDALYDDQPDVTAKPVVTYSGQWVGARIARADSGLYALTWTDYVANDYRADYSTLSDANGALLLILTDEHARETEEAR